MKNIYDNNPGNDLGAGWNSINVSANTAPTIEGCAFGTVCGETRLTSLNISNKNITTLDIKNLTALQYLTLIQLPNATFSGLDLDLANKPNLQLLSLQVLPNATFSGSDLDLANKPNLQQLILNQLPNATYSGSDLDLTNNPNLQILYLYYLLDATFSGSDLDLTNNPNLQNLFLQNLPNATFTASDPLDLRANTKLSYLVLIDSNFTINSVRILSSTLNSISYTSPVKTDPIYNTAP